MPHFSEIPLMAMREFFDWQTTTGALATGTNRVIASSASQQRISLTFLMVQASVATKISIKDGTTAAVMVFNVAANTPVFITFPLPGLTGSTNNLAWNISHSDAGSVDIDTTVIMFRGALNL